MLPRSRRCSFVVGPTLFIAALYVAACSTNVAPLDAALDTVAPAADRATPPDRGLKPDAPPAADVCGTLVDDAGQPVDGARIQVCGQACFLGTSVARGRVCVAVELVDHYIFHVFGQRIGGVRLADTVFPLAITAALVAANAKIDVGTVVVPRVLTASQSLDPKKGGTLTFAGGERLVVAAGATKAAAGLTTVDVTAVRIAPTKLPPRLLSDHPRAKNVALAYVFGPLHTTFAPAASYALPKSGLAANVRLDVLWAHDRTGKLQAAGEAEVDAAGVVRPRLGKGLDAFGTLLFVPQTK